MMDRFFDRLNVRNTKEYIINRKPFLKPYESVGVIRFAWLDEFWQYLKSWKESIEARNGVNYTKTSKSKMLIFLFLLNYVHIQLGQKNLNKKQLKIQWTQHLSKSPV